MQNKNLIFLGSSRKDLKEFPKEIQQHVGYALFRAQCGRKHEDAKPMKGFKSTIWEIVSRYFGNAYRTVYYIEVDGAIYVLHTFQKKSHHGISTAKNEIETIKNRLKAIL